MGAGIRKDLLNKRIYRSLKKLQRELACEGLLFAYKQYGLTLRVARVLIDVRYRIIRASNGEVAGLLRMTITNDENGGVNVKEPVTLSEIVNRARGEVYFNFVTRDMGPALKAVDQIVAQLIQQKKEAKNEQV